MVHDQVSDDVQAARVRLFEQALEVLQRTIVRVDVVEVRNIVPVVLQRRGVHRQEPDAIHTERLHVIQLLDDAAQIAMPVAIGVLVGADIQFVENGVVEPRYFFMHSYSLITHSKSNEACMKTLKVSVAYCQPVINLAGWRCENRQIVRLCASPLLVTCQTGRTAMISHHRAALRSLQPTGPVYPFTEPASRPRTK